MGEVLILEQPNHKAQCRSQNSGTILRVRYRDGGKEGGDYLSERS